MGLRWFSNLFLQKGNAVEQLKKKLPIGVRLDKNAMLYNFAVFIILPKTEGFILSVKQINIYLTIIIRYVILYLSKERWLEV